MSYINKLVLFNNKNLLIGGETYDIKHHSDGISRKKQGDTFIYYYIKSGKTTSAQDENRIKKLKIPPAWINVWISTDPNNKIQAMGTDDKGRKQYIYSQQQNNKQTTSINHFMNNKNK